MKGKIAIAAAVFSLIGSVSSVGLTPTDRVTLPNVNGKSFTPFNDGKTIAAGLYKISYVTGGYYVVQNDPNDTPIAAWTTAFSLYLKNSNGTIVTPMPGVGLTPHADYGIYKSLLGVEKYSYGQSITVNIPTGVYGLYDSGNVGWYPNGGSNNNPEFSINLLASSVPEPSSIYLLLAGFIFLSLRKKLLCE